jgi:hypothetical protein
MIRRKTLFPAILGLLIASVLTVEEVGADSAPAPQQNAPGSTLPKSAPLAPRVTQNPDGTITVRKTAATGSGPLRAGVHGLVIPAQIITPIVPAPHSSPSVNAGGKPIPSGG